MNCVIYSRVSTNLQDNERAINELKNYAELRKLHLLGVFSETITGASKAFDRKVFSEMTDFVQKNDVQHILIWEFTRLGRNTADTLSTINFFSELKVNIYSYKENLNTLRENGERDPSTLLICNMLASFSELERDSIKQRSKSGIRANVASGGSGQGIIKPYGYKVLDKKLVIDEEEAKVVKLIFELYLKGSGTTKIAKYLNEHSIPTKYNKTFGNKIINLRRIEKKGNEFHWVDGTVHHLLTNPIYKGKRRHGHEFFHIEPIVSEEVFDKVQSELKNNYNKKGNNQRYPNPLKEKVVCGKCGKTYYMHLRKDNKDKAYRCLSKRVFRNCGNPSIGIDKLHNALFQMLKSNMLTEFYRDISKSIESNRTKISELNVKKSELTKRINKLLGQQTKLMDLYLDDKVTKDEFSERNISIQNQISENKIDIIKHTSIIESLENEIVNLEEMNLPSIDNTKSIFENFKNFKLNDFDNFKFPETTKELYILAINKYLDKIIINEFNDDVIRKDYFRNKQDVVIRIDFYLKYSNTPSSLYVSQRTFLVLKAYDIFYFGIIQPENSINYYPINKSGDNLKFSKTRYMVLSDKPNDSLKFTND